MKSPVEYKVRRLAASINDHGMVDVFLRGDGRPFRFTKLVNIEPYAIDAGTGDGRIVTFDPADIMAVVAPPAKQA